MALRSVLYPSHVGYLLGTKRFLRYRFIGFTITLDMQTIFHIRREGIYPA